MNPTRIISYESNSFSKDILERWIQDHESQLEAEAKVYEYFEEVRDRLKQSKGPNNMHNVLRCWDLYNLISDDYRAILNHWFKAFEEQQTLHKSYSKMQKPPRQDNKTYYNRQERWGSNRNKIRYPKKKRKTAWKRFYRLFPHLDPKNSEDANK